MNTPKEVRLNMAKKLKWADEIVPVKYKDQPNQSIDDKITDSGYNSTGTIFDVTPISLNLLSNSRHSHSGLKTIAEGHELHLSPNHLTPTSKRIQEINNFHITTPITNEQFECFPIPTSTTPGKSTQKHQPHHLLNHIQSENIRPIDISPILQPRKNGQLIRIQSENVLQSSTPKSPSVGGKIKTKFRRTQSFNATTITRLFNGKDVKNQINQGDIVTGPPSGNPIADLLNASRNDFQELIGSKMSRPLLIRQNAFTDRTNQLERCTDSLELHRKRLSVSDNTSSIESIDEFVDRKDESIDVLKKDGNLTLNMSVNITDIMNNDESHENPEFSIPSMPNYSVCSAIDLQLNELIEQEQDVVKDRFELTSPRASPLHFDSSQHSLDIDMLLTPPKFDEQFESPQKHALQSGKRRSTCTITSQNYNLKSDTDIQLNSFIELSPNALSTTIAATSPPPSPPNYSPYHSASKRAINDILYVHRIRTPPKEKQASNQLKRSSSSRWTGASPAKRKLYESSQPSITLRTDDFCGIARFDIIIHLSKYPLVLQLIFNQLTDEDVRNCYNVSQVWRQLIVNDRKTCKRRTNLLRNRQQSKENLCVDVPTVHPESEPHSELVILKKPFTGTNIDSEYRKRALRLAQRSPPTSPAKRRFRESQNFLSRIGPKERVTKCPRCNQTSVIKSDKRKRVLQKSYSTFTGPSDRSRGELRRHNSCKSYFSQPMNSFDLDAVLNIPIGSVSQPAPNQLELMEYGECGSKVCGYKFCLKCECAYGNEHECFIRPICDSPTKEDENSNGSVKPTALRTLSRKKSLRRRLAM